MSKSIQVLYLITETTNFDYNNYFSKYLKLVKNTFGDCLDSIVITKDLARYYAIATMIFKNQLAMDLALSEVGPVMEDILNYNNADSVMVIDEVVN